uniref:DUF2723 domain-containing protein n=1 Tax=Steinernema glaseri TaxID=37863 RepID=A0A1I8AB00_9BILA
MFTVSHKTIDRNFPALMYQLRAAELVACFFQMSHIGFGYFLLPTIFLSLEVTIVFSRWFNEIDGRYDFQQMTSERKDGYTKAQYACNLYGSVVLAVLVHCIAVDMESGLSAFVFGFADYVAILSAAFCAAVESFEGAKAKYA